MADFRSLTGKTATPIPEVPVVRWGVMGCARIAIKNVRAMHLSPEARLAAVASRNIEKSANWVKKFVPEEDQASITVYGSYDELLAPDNGIDAIYVPLPTTLHREWVPRVAAAGKHIICEKPVGVNVEDMKVILEACKASKVVFMDGVMFMHNDRLPKMLRYLYDPLDFFGPVTRIITNFSFRADEAFLSGGDIRSRKDGDPLGCVGDLGWYCVRFALCCFRNRRPECVRCIAVKRNVHGVPIEMSAEVYWPEIDVFTSRPTLQLHCSFLLPYRQRAEVVGNSRSILCNDFVLSDPNNATFTVEQNAGLHDMFTKPVESTSVVETRECVQEQRMFTNFARAVNAGADSELAQYHAEISINTQVVVDALMKSADMEGNPMVSVEIP